jgi:hypothetical protein
VRQLTEALQIVTDSESKLVRCLIDDVLSSAQSPSDREKFFDRLSKLGLELQKCFEREESVLASLGMGYQDLDARKRVHDHIIEQYADLNLRLMRGAQLELEDFAFLDLKPMCITVSKQCVESPNTPLSSSSVMNTATLSPTALDDH